ncbi:hypothetical protein C2E25_07945 [Geothermobacter hydrogeniphilus]|uniref:Uncharacterized protein n=1 Tax=Geothermobacter hydrogeniphilus TaxID=1969733 RepID=A0A2K2HAK8_9BACT|nr:hypothetical protein C2E25_07945 [Geothermobacter hydrogeniphilus]
MRTLFVDCPRIDQILFMVVNKYAGGEVVVCQLFEIIDKNNWHGCCYLFDHDSGRQLPGCLPMTGSPRNNVVRV